LIEKNGKHDTPAYSKATGLWDKTLDFTPRQGQGGGIDKQNYNQTIFKVSSYLSAPILSEDKGDRSTKNFNLRAMILFVFSIVS